MPTFASNLVAEAARGWCADANRRVYGHPSPPDKVYLCSLLEARVSRQQTEAELRPIGHSSETTRQTLLINTVDQTAHSRGSTQLPILIAADAHETDPRPFSIAEVSLFIQGIGSAFLTIFRRKISTGQASTALRRDVDGELIVRQPGSSTCD